MTDLFQKLESNNIEEAQTAKQAFHEQFNTVKEPWLLNGFYEYYLSTNSARSMEILVNIREPHHGYLFDKLCESIKSSKTETKVQALTLLGHVLRRQPTWLYKIMEHHLFREILKLLKTEMEILPLLSALLVLVVLLPIIPSLMGDYLSDVFEIFSRLAAWNCNNPGKLVEEQMVHMQVALYALFQRLYGMYPCNFLAYLRNQYRDRNLMPIFIHTIKPMLETVKMHPHLVTASKDNETTTARWKKMGVHDVIVECERLSLDVSDRCPHESCPLTTSFRSRSGTTSSGTVESPYPLMSLKNTPLTSISHELDFYSPSMMFQSQTPPATESGISVTQAHLGVATYVPTCEGTSPPEAAIEATPETTPIKDVRSSRSYPSSSGVVKALNTFTTRNWSVGSGTTTPTHSQPSSPMRKEASPFNFSSEGRPQSAFSLPKRDSYTAQKLQRLIQDRNQINESQGELDSKSRNFINPPSSPLRIIPSGESNLASTMEQRVASPVMTEDDEEIVSIIRQREVMKQPLRQCDSVIQEAERDDDVEDCEQETGSPCTAGGLHMPNSRSMNELAKRVRRFRYYSQCADTEHKKISTGSSPGKGEPCPNEPKVRRANSCPEMKKSHAVPAKGNDTKALTETDEETVGDIVSNGVSYVGKGDITKLKQTTSSETQTENFWPMPYEHLFLSIFPSLENADIKPSPSPSPAPLVMHQEKCYSYISIHEILDRYIEVAVQSSDRESGKIWKDHLQLLHQQLLFERHRREIHAIRNRRLLADARNTRVFEEHNSALRDQVQLQQRDIDSLKIELESIKKEKFMMEKEAMEKMLYWENYCKTLEEECKTLRSHNEDLKEELSNLENNCIELDKKWQAADAALLDATAEAKVAIEQVCEGAKVKTELERVNRELLLFGELHMRYQERLTELPLLRKSDQELVYLKESYAHELKSVTQQLESKITSLEACKTRIMQLEQTLVHNEESFSMLKRKMNEIKEEYYEKLEAVESKYQAQLSINKALEENILDLWQKVEHFGCKNIYSPDTSSCHEVNATVNDRTSIAAGLSPHSSPLSASLASSEGSAAFLHPDMKDIKNIQAIVDQKEPLSSQIAKQFVTNDCGNNTSSSSQLQPGPSKQEGPSPT